MPSFIPFLPLQCQISGCFCIWNPRIFAYEITLLMTGCFCHLHHYCFFASDLSAVNVALHSSLPLLPSVSFIFFLTYPVEDSLGSVGLGFFFQNIWHDLQCYIFRVWLSLVLAVTACSALPQVQSQCFKLIVQKVKNAQLKTMIIIWYESFNWHHKWTLWHPSSLMILSLLFSTSPSFSHFKFKFCNKQIHKPGNLKDNFTRKSRAILRIRKSSSEKIMCILYHKENEHGIQRMVSVLSEHIQDIFVYKGDKHLSLFLYSL